MEIVRTKNNRWYKLIVNGKSSKRALDYLPIDKKYCIRIYDEDFHLIKDCKVSDCLKDVIYEIIYEKPFLDSFFDNEISLRHEKGRFYLDVLTKTYKNDDLRHDKFTRKALLESLISLARTDDQFDKEAYYLYGIKNKGYCNLSLYYYPQPNETIGYSVTQLLDYIKQLSHISLMKLDNCYWDDAYSKDEALFTNNLLLPLLRKMNFQSVQHNHGVDEFGKDIVISQFDEFGFLNYYGVQIKAGDISGKVNSKIDELIGQINDAFLVPYRELGSENDIYITGIYIIISGCFSKNAKEKILHKINPIFKGKVKFIDKEKTLELIYKYWK